MRNYRTLVSIVVLVTTMSCSILSPFLPGTRSPTPTPTTSVPGILSQNDFSDNDTQAFMDEAQRVERVADLLAWGIEQGYFLNPPVPVAGGSATYVDGTTVYGVIFDKVTLLKFTTPGNPEPAYYLAKVNGSDIDPELMLFD